MINLEFTKALLDFQKTTLDSSYYIYSLTQDRLAALTEMISLQANWIPREGERTMAQWRESVSQYQNEFKRALDQSFDSLLDILSA